MVFGSSCGWSKATEFNVSATSDTLLPDEDEVVDVSSGKSMEGDMRFVG